MPICVIQFLVCSDLIFHCPAVVLTLLDDAIVWDLPCAVDRLIVCINKRFYYLTDSKIR
jgi:hypothetical protein